VSKGMPGGRIRHAARHIAGIFRGGKLPQFNNPHYEVKDQNEPTPQNPISQHKQFKGHDTHVGPIPGIPK
jgi:hypothetical protein